MLRALGSASGDISHETGSTICLRALESASCDITHETGGNDLLRALGSAACEYHARDRAAVCDGHWVLRLVISHTRQGARFVTGIGFCVL